MLDYILVFKYLKNLVPRCLSTLQEKGKDALHNSDFRFPVARKRGLRCIFDHFVLSWLTQLEGLDVLTYWYKPKSCKLSFI